MPLVKYSFSAGELAPELVGRSDLERYDLAAKELRNVVVNYGGGANKRRGTRFINFIPYGNLEHRLFEFQLSETAANTYLLLFVGGTEEAPAKILFVQDNGYVLDESIVVDVLAGVATLEDHGFPANHLVFFGDDNTPYLTHSVTDDTFEVAGVAGAAVPADGEYTVHSALQLDHVYANSDLRKLKAFQAVNELKITHQSYPPYIIKLDEDGFSFIFEDRNHGRVTDGTPGVVTSGKFIKYIRVTDGGSSHDGTTELVMSDSTGSGWRGTPIIEEGVLIGVTTIDPGHNYTAPSLSTTGAGSDATFDIGLSNNDAGYVFAVAPVYPGGIVGGIMRPRVISAGPDYTTEAGFATVGWWNIGVPEATRYNVYRSAIIPDGDKIHNGFSLGFIGNTRGQSFTDNNIVPDFTQTPRYWRDPFANGAIELIKLTNPVAGVTHQSTVTLHDPTGTGFAGLPIVIDGEAVSVHIIDRGRNYTGGVIDITFGSTLVEGGATLTVTPQEGNYPSCAFAFQQRHGYAGTLNAPMNVWASRIGDPLDWTEAEITTSDDAYEYTMDSTVVRPIKHALPVQQGLLLFSPSTIGLLRGEEGIAVTALSAIIDPQSFIGSAEVSPELVAEDVVYVSTNDRSFRMLSFEPSARRYVGREVSILSRHLFSGIPVRSMAFSYSTDKTGILVMDSGIAYTVTLDRDQELFAFTQISTRGWFRDVQTVQVAGEEHTYLTVKREVNGMEYTALEIILPEASPEIEDAIYLDSTITLPKNFPDATATIVGDTPDLEVGAVITVTASAEVFDVDVEGQILGIGCGRGVVTTRVSGTVVEVTLTRKVTKLVPESLRAMRAGPGAWWLNPLVTTVTGFPYEGATVVAVADGKQVTEKTVVNGSITLDHPAAIVHVGFPFKTRVTTLPLVSSEEVLEGKLISVNSAWIRVGRAGAFTVGRNHQYDISFRTNEPWNEPTRLDQLGKLVTLDGGWSEDGIITIESDNGLPLEILHIVIDYNASD